MKFWEIIADNLSKTEWSYGYVSALDRKGCTIWIVDAHRRGKRFVLHSDEKLTAFLELAQPFYSVQMLAVWLRRGVKFRRCHDAFQNKTLQYTEPNKQAGERW